MSPVLQNLFAKVSNSHLFISEFSCGTWCWLTIMIKIKSSRIKNFSYRSLWEWTSMLVLSLYSVKVWAHYIRHPNSFAQGLRTTHITMYSSIASALTSFPFRENFSISSLSASNTSYNIVNRFSRYEFLFRKVFSLITFYDTSKQELAFRCFDDIGL